MALITEAYFETGTEGVYYQLYDTSKQGYEGIVKLNNGDQLTIFNDQGGLAWCGIINKDLHSQQFVKGRWVHWVQTGVSPEYWDSLFQENFRAEIIPA